MHTAGHLAMSICIPAYEMGGRGAGFLGRLLRSIRTQSFANYETIVSDHCAGDEIKQVCSCFSGVRHVSFSEKKGNSSANLNNALKCAQGEFIKVIFQDDFLSADDSLERMTSGIGDQKWLAHGYWHTDQKGKCRFSPTIPRMPDNPKELASNNTIGAPTAVMFRNCDLRFDENLMWFMDCEFYYRLACELGQPTLISDPLAVQTLWPGQLSRLLDEEIKNREYNYVRNKHG
jgi:glycosyltransferase involved in cell wall biosynthesis